MQIDNVALRGVATQSSLWSNDVAQLAIDGNRDANLADRSCSSTSEETNPWWRVDLLGRYSVTAVTVTNREDCCPTRIDGAEIHIGNSLDNNGIDNPRCAVISNIPAGQTYTFQCNEMEGRYVVLVIPGQAQYLTLCEVEVYGYLVMTQQVVRLKLAQKDQNMNLTDVDLQVAILQQGGIGAFCFTERQVAQSAVIPAPNNSDDCFSLKGQFGKG
ncbi:fucolectin-like [Esox lucius]|uniref:fucolectin-like n=1 Tax=Esox lucius TaxID=8010 RepID=UPI0010BD4752|nr:fucolectin-like [Esox lucius]